MYWLYFLKGEEVLYVFFPISVFSFQLIINSMIKGTVSRDYLIKYSLLVSVDICDMAAEFHAISVQVAVLNKIGLQNKISVD